MLDRIDLFTFDDKVAAPEGIVYSTSPRTATSERGVTYFVKGPEPEIVFAELAGCLLAKSVSLAVAPVSVCSFNEQLFCGSEKVADIGRNIGPWLRNPPGIVTNFTELYSAIVVDIWLANEDRNTGNVVASSVGRGKVKLTMIDFEKSAALRPNPVMTCAMIDPKKLWPSGDLGQALRIGKGLHPPATMVTSIKLFVEAPGKVASVINAVTERFQAVEWSDGVIDAVTRRGLKISELAEQVWSLS